MVYSRSNSFLQGDDVVAFVSESLRARIVVAHRKDDGLKAHDRERRDLFRQTLFPHKKRSERRKTDVEFLSIFKRQNRDDSQLVFAEFECVQLQFFELFEIVNEIQEFLVADDVHALRVSTRIATEHQPQSATNRLLRQNVGFCRVWTQTYNHGHVLDVPAFTKHEHADDGVDWAVVRIDVADGFSSLVKFVSLISPLFFV